MDLVTHLESLVAVAEERSFSRAAERLGIAQPLLSRRIRGLELELGGALFERSARRVAVTDFGALLLPHAQDVVTRVGQLRAVASSARRGAIHALGMPPDCEPAALARIIREAGRRGLTLRVVEAAAAGRDADLQAGRLVGACRRVAGDRAQLVVPLGLAGVPVAAAPVRPVHLDALRPRRGATDPAPVLLIMDEDDQSAFRDRLVTELARSGVPAEQLHSAGAAGSAVAEVLADRGRLLCDEAFARRHELDWSPLADARLFRGYDLVLTPPRLLGGEEAALREWLTPLVRVALGATAPPVDAVEVMHRVPLERLAAQA